MVEQPSDGVTSRSRCQWSILRVPLVHCHPRGLTQVFEFSLACQILIC
jgi:hypothetical protein